MDKLEAEKVLTEFVEELQKKPHDELVQLIRNPICVEVEGSSGTQYQVEYEAFWDSEPGGLLRIIASVDDGGFISFLSPLSQSFLVDSEGKVLT